MRSRHVFLLCALVLSACSGGSEAAPTTTTQPTTTTSTTTTTLPPLPRSSLTGLEVDDDVIERVVVAVKYDNVHGRSTPQVGISAADVIYEIPVEGTVTRFLALFQSTDAAPIGPVRSARGSEVGLLEELNGPLFTWHGANRILARLVRNAALIPRSIDDIPHLFFRESSRPSPYNSFALGTKEIRETAPEDSAGPPEPILTFVDTADDEDEAPPSPLAVAASVVNLSFAARFGGNPDFVPVRFEWNEERGEWLRFQGDEPHLDGDGEHIGAQNVIVRFTTAVDSGTIDAAGSSVPTAVVTGEGVAWIFSRGTVTVGTWSKPDTLTHTSYLDADGDAVLLTPGRTWIAMPFNEGSQYS